MDSSQEEVVYGSDAAETTHEGSTGGQDVMSEKVENLARDIYAEFKRMMDRYDQDVVKDLMPLVVNVLESLDLAGIENQEHQVELELVKEDHEQLVTQYEREKCHRKNAEQRLLEVEFSNDEERNELQSKVESLESIVRMLEMKAKNSADHASRLEDKENEMKKEYAKLHERYTELFKTHFDYVEKTKILFGASQNAKQGQGQTMPTTPVEASSRLAKVSADIRSPEELHKGWKLEQFSPDKDLSMSEALSQPSETTMVEPIQDKTRVRRPNTLYQECKFADKEDQRNNGKQNSAAPTDEDAFDAGAVSDNIFGMGKEVENIILENIELLATKNALNIVKDDLIARVDQLTSEKDVCEERLRQTESQRDAARERVEALETEIKRLKEEADRLALEREQGDTAVPMSQRKRFTRVEMARVLMERNQYKEKLMELQDAVRWSETLKATKLTEGSAFDKPHTGGGGIFKFPNFSNLFASDKGKTPTAPLGPGSTASKDREPRTKASLQNIRLRDGISERKAKERRDQLKKVKAHVAKDDIGRVQAYGWSLPTANGQSPLQSVPVPVFCRPLDQNDPNPQLKVWCASGVHLPQSAMPREQLQDSGAQTGSQLAEMTLSSLVWICSGVQSRFSQVSVIDANNPAEVLETFRIGTSLILCIQSVPGVREDDFICNEAYLSACINVENKSNESGIMTKAEPGLNAVSEMVREHNADRPGFKGGDAETRGVYPNATLGADQEYLAPAQREGASVVDVPSPETEAGVEPLPHDPPQQAARPQTTGSAPITPEKMSTQLPTMWMGAQNGYLYVHSSKADWSTCILKFKLSDCVLSIVHHRGRVFCSLANGRLAIFHRDPVTREFSASHFREIVVSPEPEKHSLHCVGVVLDTKIWCGYRNTMAVLDAQTLDMETRFSVHPRKDSQVRKMASASEGVWITIRLDSTFRLYHARTHQHLQDVDIEPMISRMIGAGKLGFSFVRITCIGITCNRLWIGTGNGVILSLPLLATSSQSNSSAKTTLKKLTSTQSLPDAAAGPTGFEETATTTAADAEGGPYSLGATNPISPVAEQPVRFVPPSLPGSCLRVDDLSIPYCNITQAQLSFHGHKDSVRFILGVPGTGGMISTTSPAAVNQEGGTTPPARCMFVLSGGEGYVDLRMDEENVGSESLSDKSDLSHLIVWEVAL
ncbi:C-Jun-amino-terminal kinase-interacting protein 3-like isoform X3 [Varroa jacobsoni]|uniref:JNK-interacting protein 3 n=1 Tax=Varroa destructor TaxID=109461 RepID=A0A7M7KJH4_VARDE|nr:C-Jun-amino-terminal kinase-interacting protein 3-like isoform X3 [Varroa destructor]XP_022690852.1 C-Jun-amino-terminal kinase-interacting protein 3-like isoform X3 [Varroa jacobsoni]